MVQGDATKWVCSVFLVTQRCDHGTAAGDATPSESVYLHTYLLGIHARQCVGRLESAKSPGEQRHRRSAEGGSTRTGAFLEERRRDKLRFFSLSQPRLARASFPSPPPSLRGHASEWAAITAYQYPRAGPLPVGPNLAKLCRPCVR